MHVAIEWLCFNFLFQAKPHIERATVLTRDLSKKGYEAFDGVQKHGVVSSDTMIYSSYSNQTKQINWIIMYNTIRSM